MLLVTGFATLSQIANHCQISCGIKTFCYSWVNVCDLTRLRHKYKWSLEILMTSTILDLKLLYSNMRLPTTLGPQVSHHLNPAMRTMCEQWRNEGGSRGNICPRTQYFGGAKLRSEYYVLITKCQMSVDANNYNSQNVEVHCKISIKITKVRKASNYEPKWRFNAPFLSPAISVACGLIHGCVTML